MCDSGLPIDSFYFLGRLESRWVEVLNMEKFRIGIGSLGPVEGRAAVFGTLLGILGVGG